MGDLSQELLNEAMKSWAPAVQFYEEVDSTNRVASEWAGHGASEGSLVVANHQTAGRGRLDRQWFSPPGSSLLFSLILRPSIVTEDLGLLNLAAATAACGAVAEEGLEPKVKWPNDVLLDGRKVAGILSEASLEFNRAIGVILGVGINVNIPEEEFPEEIRDTAGSISIGSGREHNRLDILTSFLRNFGRFYNGMPEKPPSVILNAYRPLCDTIGRDVRVELQTGSIEGRAVDVDMAGGLVLESGEVVRVGDVVHLR
jgi:BirA family transcriptional regulator, biotin operon repressor / biotin---[acetyl-CoA-carboxylase] ligase